MQAKNISSVHYPSLQLGISSIAIFIIGLAYGLYPQKVLPALFDFSVATTDSKNIFRAVMGLYIAMALTWMAGVVRREFWRTATISNIGCMGGLAGGRLISLIADGRPSLPLIIGLAGELLLAGWGLYNLKRYGAAG